MGAFGECDGANLFFGGEPSFRLIVRARLVDPGERERDVNMTNDSPRPDVCADSR